MNTVADQKSLVNNEAGIARSKAILSKLFVLVLTVVLLSLTLTKMSGRYEIVKDAKENTLASYHLFDKGIISLDGVTKSQFREPLPIFVSAMNMALFTDIPKKLQSIDEICQTPHYIKQINQTNVFYILVALLLIWRLSFQLTGSNLIASIAMILSWTSFYIQPWYLSRPLTEFAASIFIVLISSISLDILKVDSQSNRMLFLSFILGCSIALLSLTKAVGLYVGIIYLPLFSLMLTVYKKWSLNQVFKLLAVASIGVFIFIGPWSIRNADLPQNKTNQSSSLNASSLVSSRGGSILLARTLKNKAIAEDPAGAMYVYSPPILQKYIFENMLGYDSKELWGGGKYASLNRNVQFNKNPNGSALSFTKEEKAQIDMNNAQKNIVANFKEHFVASFVFAWRGIWSFGGGNHLRPSGESVLMVVLNVLSFASFFLLLLYGVLKKKGVLTILVLFPMGYFLIYALFSHYIPRYSSPLIPISIVCFLLLIIEIYKTFRRDRRR